MKSINNTYNCELHGSGGKITEVECPVYSAKFIYKTPNEADMSEEQKNKYDLVKRICGEECPSNQ